MAPRKLPPRTAADEKKLQSALKKVERAGKDPTKTVGGSLRQGWKENA